MNNEARIIICSTPYSRRLKEKCFMKIGNKPVLSHIFDRIAPLNIKTILAIPTSLSNEHEEKYHNLISQSKLKNWEIWRGNSKSPLHRMTAYLSNCNSLPKYIIRITHDDILIDYKTVEMLLAETIKQNAGYSVTPTIVEGAGVEIIHVANLIEAGKKNKGDIEHISYFVKGKYCPVPKIIKLRPRQSIERKYCLTLDYYEDFIVLETIFRNLGVNSSVDEICEFLDEHQCELLKHNRKPLLTIYSCIKDNVKWFSQSFKSFDREIKNNLIEFIIIDDYSKGKALLKILKTSAYNKRIKIILNEKNLGLASSSNIALNMAKGKYIMRIDADDRFNPDYDLSFVISTLIKNMRGGNIIYSNYDEIDEKNNLIRGNVSAKIHHHAGCALMETRWLRELKFKEGLKHWDSRELYLRIKDRFKIAYIEEPLWCYRIHSESMSRNNLKEREKCKP